INKQAFVDQGYKIQGQTEFLASACGCREVAMMFIGDRLKVGLITTHVALRDVFFTITTDMIVSKTFLVHIFLKKFFNLDSPAIAVCSLDPHAGEGGKLGGEDIKIVSPAIAKLQEKGVAATGPHSADTVFHQHLSGRFDAVMALYHDQGLAPFKVLHFEDGVNVSVGLPFIRTSPDHGVAYDIAGKGIANPASMISAVKLAKRLAAAKKRDE
ncbi:MAG: 4-hydroxythreonine-4-phosphate dehydrogenase PdxA, partial [Deltaproteobacteria bacterium]|nr:4-hydroxythreonine-4-phosphate dehydrogenase PdxA [Deltaproteobacteria bacterium]